MESTADQADCSDAEKRPLDAVGADAARTDE